MITWSTVGGTLLIGKYSTKSEQQEAAADVNVTIKLAAFDLVGQILGFLAGEFTNTWAYAGLDAYQH